MPHSISPGETPRQRRQRQRPKLTPNPKARLRDQVHEVMRFLHRAERTEEAYWQWIVRYLKFHRGKAEDRTQKKEPGGAHGVTRPTAGGWRHPKALGAAQVNRFLSHLATELNVAAATQNQALNALVFLYGEVLHQPLGELGEFQRVRRPARLPEVLSRAETQRVLAAVEPDYALPLKLLYGSGLRLFELLRLRVKDLDLERGQIVVRDGKGSKDRVTGLPDKLKLELQTQLKQARTRWAADVKAGYSGVWLPEALARKYPSAPKEWPLKGSLLTFYTDGRRSQGIASGFMVNGSRSGSSVK